MKLSFPWVLFLLSSIIQLLYLRIGGVHMGGDSEFYLQGASILSHSNFSFIHLIGEGHPLYYLAYPTFLALLQNNILLVVGLQIILQAFANVLVYKTVARLHSQEAGIISGLVCALSFELFQWNTYILTDSLFIFLIIAALYLHTKKSWYIFIAILCGMILLRPTAAPFLLAVVVSSTWHFKKIHKILGYTTFLLVVLYIVAHILSLDAGMKLGVSGYIHYFASLFERGVLVRDRASLVLPIEWASPLNIIFLRLLLFWAPAISDFSLLHTLLNLITLLPIYIFGILGISKYSKRFILGISVIIVFWIFQSFTELDYDWRYRLPVLPALIIFAGMGAADYLILNILHLVFDISIFWSVFWGFISGGIIGYFFHSRFTFRYNTNNKEFRKLSSYLLLAVANLALTEIVVHNLTVYTRMHYNASKFIALLLVASVSFTASKFIIFRPARVGLVIPEKHTSAIKTKSFYVLFLLGIILLYTNVIGLYRNFSFDQNRDPNIAIRTINELLQDKTISDDMFARKINSIVHENIDHYWPTNPTGSLRIPFSQNYLLYLASFVKPSIYRNYEYCSYTRAIQRGVGLCSEAAIVATDILEHKGIESHILYFNGHVATVAKFVEENEEYWLYLDPYFNVIIRTNFNSLDTNPDLIRPYYENVGLDQGNINLLVSFMKDTPNTMFERGVTGYTDCNWKKITVRKVADVVKWVLPLILIAPVVSYWLRKRKMI